MMRRTRRTRTGAAASWTKEADQLVTTLSDHTRELASTLERLTAAMSGEDLSSALTNLIAVRERSISVAGSDAALEQLQRGWSARLDREFLEIEHFLRAECERRHWRLDGQWPRFYVERAVTVAIDEKAKVITIAEVKIEGPNSRAIMERLELLVRNLLPRGFSSRGFMAPLAEAYDSARGDRHQVSILSVYRELVLSQQKPRFWRNATSETFVGLSIDQFRARCSRALEESVTAAPDGRELRLLPSIEPTDAIFIYQPAESRFGFVGRIEFARTARDSD